MKIIVEPESDSADRIYFKTQTHMGCLRVWNDGAHACAILLTKAVGWPTEQEFDVPFTTFHVPGRPRTAAFATDYSKAKGLVDAKLNTVNSNHPRLYKTSTCAPQAPVLPQTPNSNKGNTTMNTTQEMITVIQLQQGATIVSARYVGDNVADTHRVYHFKNVVGLKLEKGDLVVCQSRDSYALLQVESPSVRANQCGCALAELKHVVQKVDHDGMDAIMEAENNAAHQLALSEVTQRIDVYRKQVGDSALDSVQKLLSTGGDDAVVEEA